MNRLLLIDCVRRNWKFLVCAAILGMPLWIAGGEIADGKILAMSMALAEFAGPLMAAQFVAPREVRHLPLSRQEIWRTRYGYGTFVVIGAITIGKVAAMALADTPGFETLTLSIVLDVLFAASASLLILKLPMVTAPVGAVLVGLAFLTTPLLPFAFANELPTRWSQIGPVHALVMIAALGVAIAGYFRAPRTVVTPSPAATRAAFRARRKLTPSVLDRVTGLNRLALKAWLGALATQTGILVIVPTMFWGFSVVIGDQAGLWDEMRDFGFLPFDQSPAERPIRMNMVIVWLFGNGPSLLIGELLRLLRSLPISTGRLLGVILGVSVVTWMNGWVLLALFHVVVSGAIPAGPQLSLLTALIGTDAFIRSLQLRWRNPPWFFFTVIIIGAPVAYGVTSLPLPTDPLFLGIGVVLALASVALNKETLTKHHKVYARMPRRTPFGTEVPGQP